MIKREMVLLRLQVSIEYIFHVVKVLLKYVIELAEVLQTMGDVLSSEETEEFVHEVRSLGDQFLP